MTITYPHHSAKNIEFLQRAKGNGKNLLYIRMLEMGPRLTAISLQYTWERPYTQGPKTHHLKNKTCWFTCASLSHIETDVNFGRLQKMECVQSTYWSSRLDQSLSAYNIKYLKRELTKLMVIYQDTFLT